MSEADWEMFDALYKTLHRQGRAIEDLENRCTELERQLRERDAEARPVLSLVGTTGAEETEGARV